ncbi:hypothetical protein OROGR_017316 [Orobanche gracilis]
MGRKIDMKKIEDITRCQVTFSKRRSSVMKKANEVAVCCDVDVAFIAFSPSGRVSKFCNQRKIEDVLRRYVDLPAEMRLSNEKVEKMRKLDHIKGDASKLQYLDKQDYEVGQEKEPSLHQLSWCERNLNHSLKKVIARKNALVDKASMSNKQSNFQDSNQWDQMELESGAAIPFSSNFKEIEQTPTMGNPFTGHNPMQLIDHPWISPYSARVRGSIFQDSPFDQAKYTINEKIATSYTSDFPSRPMNTCSFPILDTPYIFPPKKLLTFDAQIPSTHFPIEESSMVDQPLLNFTRQKNNVDKVFDENCSRIFNRDETQTQGPYYVHRLKEVYRGTEFDNFLPEDTPGDGMVSTSEVHKSGLWELEDLILDGNFNFQDLL